MHLLPRVALAGVALAWAGVASAQTQCTADSCADLRFEIRPMQATPWAGGSMKWVAKAWNQGPAAARAKVEIPLPAGPGTYWTCVALQGAACDTPAQGQGGGIVNTVTLPMTGEVEYRIEVVSDPCARGPNDGRLSGKVTALDKTDPELSANSDTRTVTAFLVQTELQVTLDDGRTSASPGETLNYRLRIFNQGPSCAKNMRIEAPLAPAVVAASWTCAGEGGATCPAASGNGAPTQGPMIPPGGAAIYIIKATLSNGVAGTLPYGATVINDEPGQVARVTATDSTAIVRGLNCSAARPSIELIDPPDHRMVAVTIGGAPAPAKVTSVRQDEPVEATGDGSTGPDATIRPDGSAEVRAERAGGGDGRVYHLGFAAVDPGGARCEGEVKVCVPHSKDRPCGDGGAIHESTGALQLTPPKAPKVPKVPKPPAIKG